MTEIQVIDNRTGKVLRTAIVQDDKVEATMDRLGNLKFRGPFWLKAQPFS